MSTSDVPVADTVLVLRALPAPPPALWARVGAVAVKRPVLLYDGG